MKWAFWISSAIVWYAYLGYPLWLCLRARWWSRPVRTACILPSVSLVVAVHNEARVLPDKLRNLSVLLYPKDRLEIIVVSDGSTDNTDRLLAAESLESLRVIAYPDHQGKASALNRGIEAARGEIVIFTDARQRIEPEALRSLVANFADLTVGCVTGELLLTNLGEGAPLEGVGLYWRIEKALRKWEGAAGSVLGATGALYAVRRSLLAPLPPGTILDDVYVPLHVVRQGYRVVFEPRARAWDSLETSPKQEFKRKVRTLTGNYQLLRLAPWLLSGSNPMRFEFVSHKLLRLFVPFALAGAFLSAPFVHGTIYLLAFVLQLAFYMLGALSCLRPRIAVFGRMTEAVFAFMLLNLAAVMALINFLTGRERVWVR